jgi:hypothetical protein
MSRDRSATLADLLCSRKRYWPIWSRMRIPYRGWINPATHGTQADCYVAGTMLLESKAAVPKGAVGIMQGICPKRVVGDTGLEPVTSRM